LVMESRDHTTGITFVNLCYQIVQVAFQEHQVKKADEEHFTFTAEVSVSPTFFAWVFEFGGKIRILGPQSVKDAYAELVKKAME